jgi:hypothetical protein
MAPTMPSVRSSSSAVPAEVPDPPVGGRDDESLIVQLARGLDGLEQSPDLRREHVGVARMRGECGSEPPLGEAEAVVRRGVEIAYAELPRDIDRAPGVGLCDLAVHVPELRAAERQLAEREGRVG